MCCNNSEKNVPSKILSVGKCAIDCMKLDASSQPFSLGWPHLPRKYLGNLICEILELDKIILLDNMHCI